MRDPAGAVEIIGPHDGNPVRYLAAREVSPLVECQEALSCQRPGSFNGLANALLLLPCLVLASKRVKCLGFTHREPTVDVRTAAAFVMFRRS